MKSNLDFKNMVHPHITSAFRVTNTLRTKLSQGKNDTLLVVVNNGFLTHSVVGVVHKPRGQILDIFPLPM